MHRSLTASYLVPQRSVREVGERGMMSLPEAEKDLEEQHRDKATGHANLAKYRYDDAREKKNADLCLFKRVGFNVKFPLQVTGFLLHC